MSMQAPLPLMKFTQPTDHLRESGQHGTIDSDQSFDQSLGNISRAKSRKCSLQRSLIVQFGTQFFDDAFESMGIENGRRLGKRTERDFLPSRQFPYFSESRCCDQVACRTRLG